MNYSIHNGSYAFNGPYTSHTFVKASSINKEKQQNYTVNLFFSTFFFSQPFACCFVRLGRLSRRPPNPYDLRFFVNFEFAVRIVEVRGRKLRFYGPDSNPRVKTYILEGTPKWSDISWRWRKPKKNGENSSSQRFWNLNSQVYSSNLLIWVWFNPSVILQAFFPTSLGGVIADLLGGFNFEESLVKKILESYIILPN